MSGHSKWSQIKHKKAIADAKRGDIFGKMSKVISVAARKGNDPETNPALRMAIEKAKLINMPSANIQRAIKRAGEKTKGTLEEITIEAFGPSGIPFIIEAVTDNKNRTLSEIKSILSKNKGRMGESGSVRWMFEKRGVIIVGSSDEPREDIELRLIDAGAEDIKTSDNKTRIYTKPEEIDKVKNSLVQKNIRIESSGIEWLPKQTIDISGDIEKQLYKIFEQLNEQEDVEEIYSNLDIRL